MFFIIIIQWDLDPKDLEHSIYSTEQLSSNYGVSPFKTNSIDFCHVTNMLGLYTLQRGMMGMANIK